jgi:hypothetical protein
MLEQAEIDLPNLENLERIVPGLIPYPDPHGSHLVQVIPNGVGCRLFHDHTVSLLQVLKDGSCEGPSPDGIALNINIALESTQSFRKDPGWSGKDEARTVLDIFLGVEKEDILGSGPYVNGKDSHNSPQWSRVRGFKGSSVSI